MMQKVTLEIKMSKKARYTSRYLPAVLCSKWRKQPKSFFAVILIIIIIIIIINIEAVHPEAINYQKLR